MAFQDSWLPLLIFLLIFFLVNLIVIKFAVQSAMKRNIRIITSLKIWFFLMLYQLLAIIILMALNYFGLSIVAWGGG